MKKRILALALAASITLLCSCGEKPQPAKTDTGKTVNDSAQYVIAMNPSVAFEDGSVVSVRNDAARALSKDVSAKTATEFYSSTDWQWLSGAENGEWEKRLIRTASPWRGGDGVIPKGAPYAYTVNDDGTASLAVFDSSKMAISGCAEGDIPQNGIIMSFTGEKEEGICYTAKSDCTVTFSDVSGGNAAIVGSIAGTDTSFLNEKNAASAVVLRVYRNSRIYWQGVLNSGSTAVAFPYLSDIALSEGDSVIFTAQAVSSTDGITTGNCDLPAKTKTVIKRLKNEAKVLVENENNGQKSTTVPLMTDGLPTFTIVTSKGVDKTVSPILAKLRTGMSKALGEQVEMKNDEFDAEGRRLLVYTTRYEASKKALNEINTGRSANAGDFIIRMEGNDLVIAAGNTYSLENAIEFFLANYCRDSKAEVRADLNYVSSKYNPVKSLALAGVPIESYRIVCSHVASYIETSAAEYLRREIVRVCGKLIASADDNTLPIANEILIGDTNRTSADYSTLTNKNAAPGYTISAAKGKVSVTDEHIYAVNAGTIRLVKLLEEKGGIAAGFKETGSYDGEYSLTNGYKLTWSDEFNGTKLSDVWQSRGTNSEKNVLGGKTTITKANNVVKDGALHQETRRDGKNITAASLYSTGAKKMMFRYGYLEIRAKLPTVKGIGAAFWTQGDLASAFLEVDIYETFGNPFSVKSNLHTWGPGDSHRNLLGGDGGILNNSEGVTKAFGTEYHTIGFEWDDDTCSFYVDGKLNITFDCSAETYNCFDKAAWLILSSDPCEPSYSKNLIDDSFTFAEASYDWIHIYQKADNNAILYQKK